MSDTANDSKRTTTPVTVLEYDDGPGHIGCWQRTGSTFDGVPQAQAWIKDEADEGRYLVARIYGEPVTVTVEKRTVVDRKVIVGATPESTNPGDEGGDVEGVGKG